MFICLVKLASAVFRFSFNLWISKCLPFSVFFAHPREFLQRPHTGQHRYRTWWPTPRWFVFHIHFTPNTILFLVENVNFPMYVLLLVSLVSFHVWFTSAQTVSAVKSILYSSRSAKRSTLFGDLQCNNLVTVTVNPQVYTIFSIL